MDFRAVTQSEAGAGAGTGRRVGDLLTEFSRRECSPLSLRTAGPARTCVRSLFLAGAFRASNRVPGQETVVKTTSIRHAHLQILRIRPLYCLCQSAPSRQVITNTRADPPNSCSTASDRATLSWCIRPWCIQPPPEQYLPRGRRQPGDVLASLHVSAASGTRRSDRATKAVPSSRQGMTLDESHVLCAAPGERDHRINRQQWVDATSHHAPQRGADKATLSGPSYWFESSLHRAGARCK